MIISTLKTFTEDIVNNDFNVNDYRCLVIPEKTEVTYGFQKDVNFDYCDEHNIPYYNLRRDGGCIIHFAGNVCWAEIKPNNRKGFSLTNLDFLSSLKDYLISRGINVEQNNNDLLIDGYKVASGCAINLQPDYQRTFCAVQININTDVELIQNICKKPMVKIPKALSDYGITTEEIRDFTINFFDKN